MKFIDKLVDAISLAAKALVGTCLAIMLLISIVEVVRRYLFNASFPWSEELIRYLMIWIAFIGGAAAYKNGGLVFFDLILNKFKPKVKATINLITNTAVLCFCIYMCERAWSYTFTASVANQITVGLKISMSIPYLGIPIGLMLFVVFSLYNYRKLIPAFLAKGDGH